MTWGELKEYISQQEKSDNDFLDSEVFIYDFADGTEYATDLTELLEDTSWIPFITINHKDFDNENAKAKEASFD